MVFAQMIERALTTEAEPRKVSLHYHVTRIFDCPIAGVAFAVSLALREATI